MMGCMQETFDLFRKCPICGEPTSQIDIYPFLTLEDWAGYQCGKCKAWVDAYITPAEPSEIFDTTGYESLERIKLRYKEHLKLKCGDCAHVLSMQDNAPCNTCLRAPFMRDRYEVPAMFYF